ncbi:hypothetical protein [uncultured Elizabethkingia sp.]|uniref:hypothetical protein n=1 Tax=uncultured Elizabethkingia sp. TaxID=432638 RepID=UPI002592DAA7|nr:hypothetical protein [uncultured Elizabethkingia sp.]
MREFREIFNDLEEISKYTNFLEVVTYLSHINLNSNIETINKRDFSILLNENEITFLFGLWLKNFNNNNSTTINNIITEGNKVHSLMDELHLTFHKDFKISKMKNLEDYHKYQRNNSNILKEIIFYSGTGAYDFQYMDYFEKKYELDQNWMKNKYDIELIDIVNLYTHIKIGFNIKLNKKIYAAEDILDLYTLDFNSYLFNTNKNYKKILDLFCCNIDNNNPNNLFNDIGDFNDFKVKPIIKRENKYIIPLPSLLATAFYENFFYWMLADKDYEKKALNNRGKVAEKIVFDLLNEKFENNNVYKNILVKKNKEITITDLDILLQKEDKLVIFQVKSKKLTQLSKEGDIAKYDKDFNQAISQAYDQAKKPYYHLYNQKSKLFKSDGTEVKIERPNVIYSICIVLDSFPSLNSHIRLFYTISKDAPIALSIFDLDTMIKYLNTFDKLLSYLEIRERMMGKLVSEEEISLVQAFISGNLKNDSEYDFFYFDNTFAQQFDKTFYLPLVDKYYCKFFQLNDNIKSSDYCFCGSGRLFENCCK